MSFWYYIYYGMFWHLILACNHSSQELSARGNMTNQLRGYDLYNENRKCYSQNYFHIFRNLESSSGSASCCSMASVSVVQRLNPKHGLRGWGLIVPSDCLLCASHQEKRQHIFLVAHSPLRFDIFSRPNSISAVIQAGKVH